MAVLGGSPINTLELNGYTSVATLGENCIDARIFIVPAQWDNP